MTVAKVVAETTRQFQCTLEAARSALPHAPAISSDEFEATEDTILVDLDQAHAVMVDAWRAWAVAR